MSLAAVLAPAGCPTVPAALPARRLGSAAYTTCGMSRRRHSDENDGGQPHKRRKTSDANETEDHLESLICKVGEKSACSLESNLEGLAGVLEADLPNYKSKILRLLCTVARLLPEKLTIYTTLVGLLNARNYNFGGEFVEAMIRQLKESLKANNYNEAVYLFPTHHNSCPFETILIKGPFFI